MTVWGRQAALPRHMRRCTLCFGELEDAHHVLFRCPAYERTREAMEVKVSASAPAEVVAAVKRVRQGRSSTDDHPCTSKHIAYRKFLFLIFFESKSLKRKVITVQCIVDTYLIRLG